MENGESVVKLRIGNEKWRERAEIYRDGGGGKTKKPHYKCGFLCLYVSAGEELVDVVIVLANRVPGALVPGGLVVIGIWLCCLLRQLV